MDTFENTDFEPQTPQSEPVMPPQPPVPPQSEVYHNAGAGRRESPYADSPYVTQHREPEYQYQPQYQPPKPPKQPKNRTGAGRRILAAVLTLALVVSGCLITGFSVNALWEERNEDTVEMLSEKIQALEEQLNSKNSQTIPSTQFLSPDGTMTPGQLYAQNVDSVVAISSTVQAGGPFGPSEGTSSGSGFILSADGYVVTNYHVVENATTVEVTTHDGTVYPAQLVGSDASNDLAVLKVDAANLPAAVIGSSSELAIGDMVVAIGNPLGTLASTQTVGYVSGINREVTTDSTIINMIQTDAAINPGNSGGPLFNMKGEVIGITTAKYSGTTGSGASIEGIGFAIPIDDVKGMVSDLIQFGYVTGAYMDITVMNTDPESAAMYGLPTGAYVVSVGEGGAADRAGIQPKDIITKLGDTKVGSITDLTRALRQYKAGDTATVTVIRSGAELTLDVTLDEKPRVMPDPNRESPMPSNGDYEEWYDYFFGGK